MADFPSKRLLQAGGTLDEVAQLRREFIASDLGVQDGIVDLFRTLSVGGMREYLSNLRGEGHFEVATDTSADFSPWNDEVVPADPESDSGLEV